MIHPAITLSRTYGSGGSQVGFLVARRLSWRFCDRRILRQAALDLNVPIERLRFQEDRPSGFLEQLMNLTAFASPEVPFAPPLELPIYSRELFEAERSVMLRLLEHAPAVILGRGGFFGLKERPNTFHVSIQADLAYRVHFLLEHKIAPNEELARKAIERSDRDRSAFIRDISGLEWRDPRNFDLVLDISRDGLESCVEQIREWLSFQAIPPRRHLDPIPPKGAPMQLRTLPIFLAFLLMGVADAMGPLSSAVSSKPLVAALMPFFVFIAFAVCSVPAGVLAARIGKKKLMLIGLLLATIAVGVPAFFNPPFPLLLACIFLLGVGTTFLQVAGNPIMRDVSAEGDYGRNLALAQGIKGAGSTASSYLVTAIVGIGFFAAMGWRGAFPIFFVLMALALVFVSLLKVDEAKAEVPPGIGSSLSLLGEPVFALAVIGIFLYVGAEVCMATFLNPALAARGFTTGQIAFFGSSLFFGSLTFGRIVAGFLKINPKAFFRISAALGLLGLLLILSGVKNLVLPAVILGGLGFANIWPMLFSITVEEKPERASELSGLMCMAISGGAIVPLLMGKLGGGAKSMAFVVPAVCFVYLLVLSLKAGKKITI